MLMCCKHRYCLTTTECCFQYKRMLTDLYLELIPRRKQHKFLKCSRLQPNTCTCYQFHSTFVNIHKCSLFLRNLIQHCWHTMYRFHLFYWRSNEQCICKHCLWLWTLGSIQNTYSRIYLPKLWNQWRILNKSHSCCSHYWCKSRCWRILCKGHVDLSIHTFWCQS